MDEIDTAAMRARFGSAPTQPYIAILKLCNEVDALRAEAETLAGLLGEVTGRAKAAEARLAAVEALCDEMTGFCCDVAPDWAADVRAAARGESNQDHPEYQLTCAYCGAIYQPGRVNEPHFPSCKYSGEDQ